MDSIPLKGIIRLLVPIAIVAAFVIFMNKSMSTNSDWIEAKAVITKVDIKRKVSSNRETNEFEFQVEFKTEEGAEIMSFCYPNAKVLFPGKLKVGDTIDIKYDIDKPIMIKMTGLYY